MTAPEQDPGAQKRADASETGTAPSNEEHGEPQNDHQAEAIPPSPRTKPEAFQLTPDPPRVMRLSRKALAGFGITACLGLGGMLIYALTPSRQAQPVNLIDTGHAAKSDVVTTAPGSYDTVPKLGQPLPGDLGRPILDAQRNGTQVQPPPIASTSDPRRASAEQARQRIAQEQSSARESRLFLGGSSAGSTSPSGNAMVSGPAITTGALEGSATRAPNATGQAAKQAFLQVASNRTTASAERVTQPVSPYILQAGSIVPAALITGIRSDLPGQITAQVTQNVYDSPTGRILLIPQGSRLIGEYDSQVASGQNRVLLAWDRLILPGGRSILLDRQPGADASGFAGLQDKVNYHWGNMLRAAAISTLLGVGTEMATDNNSTLMQALRYGTEDTINQAGKQLIQRELNVAPTLTIRPGFALRVVITRDLVVEPQGDSK